MLGRTFGQYLLDLSASNRELAQVLSAIVTSLKPTTTVLARGSLLFDKEPGQSPLTPGQINQTLKAKALQALISRAETAEELAGIAVQGLDEPISLSANGKYVVAAKLVDGVGQLENNQAIGSLYSVLPRKSAPGPVTDDDFLQPGTAQCASILVSFGPQSIILVTTGSGVQEFALDVDLGTFGLSDPDAKMNDGGTQYAVDSTGARHWPAPVRRYVDTCVQGEEGPRGKDFTLHWSPTTLTNAYRIFVCGGLFLAPATSKWVPETVFYAAPLAFLAEQAGGAATTGTEPAISVVPEQLNSKSALFFGSPTEVDLISRFFKEYEEGTDREKDYPLFSTRTMLLE